MALSRAALLALYRDVLRAAARFPSKKRDAIIADIKLEFREGAVETDSAQVQRRVALAHDSLTRLRQYAGLDKASPSWDVSLGGPRSS